MNSSEDREMKNSVKVNLKEPVNCLADCDSCIKYRSIVQWQEEELKKAYQKIARNDEEANKLVALVAHEIGNPLQPLLGSLDLARKGLLGADAALDQIDKQAKRLKTIVNQIHETIVMEEGELQYCMTKGSLNSVITQAVINSIQSNCRNQTEAPSVKLDLGKDRKIEMDPTRISEVISSVIDNSMKFSKGKGTIRITTKDNQLSKRRMRLEIHVADEGPGIPNSIMPTIFDKFVTRVSLDRSSMVGLGLSLYRCKRIMEDHGGDIIASNNNPDAGTTFKIIFNVSIEGQGGDQQQSEL